MEKFEIDIHHRLKSVRFSVKNGAKFTRDLIKGKYANHSITILPEDMRRVKMFMVKHADDSSSNYGNWYAHCNGYCMDFFVNYKGEASINTYFDYRKQNKLNTI